MKAIYTREYQNMASKIKLARQRSGFNQKQVAKLLGKTQSYISKIESGQIRLDVIQLKEIAKIYKKAITFFIN